MSTNGEVLYVREDDDDDANEIEIGSGIDIQNIWDDTKLVESYDKASYLMHQAVAKRIAMQTNTILQPTPEEEAASGAVKKNKKSPKVISEWQPVEKPSSQQWKPDMPCRAVCSNDGLEYEARILAVIDEDHCVVKFLGYDDYNETVTLSSLKPTWGREECVRQIKQSLEERTEEQVDQHDSDSPASASGYEEVKLQFKKPKAQKRNFNSNPLPRLDNIDMAYVRRLGEDEVPFAPPPPLHLMKDDSSMSEQQVINSMLISWYMSGYYSGVYQGMKMSKSRNNRRINN